MSLAGLRYVLTKMFDYLYTATSSNAGLADKHSIDIMHAQQITSNYNTIQISNTKRRVIRVLLKSRFSIKYPIVQIKLENRNKHKSHNDPAALCNIY